MTILKTVFRDFLFGQATGRLESVNPGTIGWKKARPEEILKITGTKHIVQTFVTLIRFLLIFSGPPRPKVTTICKPKHRNVRLGALRKGGRFKPQICLRRHIQPIMVIIRSFYLQIQTYCVLCCCRPYNRAALFNNAKMFNNLYACVRV
jgi:hypothetical protein